MAVTETAFNACNAVVELDDANGVMRDISGHANNVDMELTKEIGDYKVFGSPYKWRLECGKDGSVTLDVVMDKDTLGGFRLLKDWYTNGGARRFRVSAPDASIGNTRWWGYFLLENLKWAFSATEAGAIMVSASLLPNGAIEGEVITT